VRQNGYEWRLFVEPASKRLCFFLNRKIRLPPSKKQVLGDFILRLIEKLLLFAPGDSFFPLEVDEVI